MPADRDHTIRDEVLEHVIAELRRPVRLDPSVDQRALEQIRAENADRAPSHLGRR